MRELTIPQAAIEDENSVEMIRTWIAGGSQWVSLNPHREIDLASACVWATRAERFADPGYAELLDNSRAALARLRRELGSDGFQQCLDAAELWEPASRESATNE